MNHSFIRFATLSVLCVGMGAGLAACDTRASNPFQPAVTRDLQNDTHSAVDDLIGHSQYTIARNTPILVGTINNVDKLERTSTFGRITTEQISSRLAQRGFSVAELKMRNSVNIKQGLGDPDESGEFLLSRDIASITPEHKAAAVVTGTYAVGGSDIFVNLKMIDVATGKLISATDYSVPLDGNTMSLVEGGSGMSSFYGTSMAY